MATTSLSILSSTPPPSLFSNSPSDSASTSFGCQFCFRKIPRFRKLKVFSCKPQLIDSDGSIEQFLKNNSVADIMRFKRDGANSAELQTAIVSYRKKFPWSPC